MGQPLVRRLLPRMGIACALCLVGGCASVGPRPSAHAPSVEQSPNAANGSSWVDFRVTDPRGVPRQLSMVGGFLNAGWDIVSAEGLPAIARERMKDSPIRIVLVKVVIQGALAATGFENGAHVLGCETTYIGISPNTINIVSDYRLDSRSARDQQGLFSESSPDDDAPYYFSIRNQSASAGEAIEQLLGPVGKDYQIDDGSVSLDGGFFSLLLVYTATGRHVFLAFNGPSERFNGIEETLINRKFWATEEIFNKAWNVFQPEPPKTGNGKN